MSRVPASTSTHEFPPVVERAVSLLGRPLTFLWSRGFRFLVVMDAIALYGLMIAISFVRFGFSFDWDTYALPHYWVGFAIATAIMLVVNYFAGLYEREPRLGVRPWLPRALLAGTAIVTLLYLALNIVYLYGADVDQLAGKVDQFPDLVFIAIPLRQVLLQQGAIQCYIQFERN